MRKEQEDLVLENLGLVRHCVKKFEGNNLIQREDLISIGTIGLIKASETFVEDKGANFATYSSRCIENEILMAFRRESKYAGTVSLQEPISVDADGNKLLLETILPDPSSNFAERIEERIAIENAVEFALNELNDKKRLAILYCIAAKTQRWIGDQLDWDQAYISRIWKGFIKDFKRKYKDGKSEDYLIRFSLKEASSENGSLIPEFTIAHKQNRIWITVFSGIECLDNIAEIIQEMSEFNFWI